VSLGESGCSGRVDCLEGSLGRGAVCVGCLAGVVVVRRFAIFRLDRCLRSARGLRVGHHLNLEPMWWGRLFLGRICSVRQQCVIDIFSPCLGKRGSLGPMLRVLPLDSWRRTAALGRRFHSP